MNARNENQQNGKQKHGIGILLFFLLIIVAGFVVPEWLAPIKNLEGNPVPGVGLTITWLVVGSLMFLIIVSIGLSLNKGPAGILIDPARNMMSLSRLQIVLWTWVILSAFVTVALVRVGDSIENRGDYGCEPPQGGTGQAPECADPLGIQLPPLVWALMGISITSAVGAPLLKATKAQRTEEEDQQRTRTGNARGAQPATYGNALKNRTRDDPILADQFDNNGALVKKTSWTLAKFSDVFMGEEVANFMYVDVAKVQNFFFTAVAVIAYVVALAVEMSMARSIASFFVFPDLSAGLMAVIGISHAGYLTDKAFPHSAPETEGDQ